MISAHQHFSMQLQYSAILEESQDSSGKIKRVRHCYLQHKISDLMKFFPNVTEKQKHHRLEKKNVKERRLKKNLKASTLAVEKFCSFLAINALRSKLSTKHEFQILKHISANTIQNRYPAEKQKIEQTQGSESEEKVLGYRSKKRRKLTETQHRLKCASSGFFSQFYSRQNFWSAKKKNKER